MSSTSSVAHIQELQKKLSQAAEAIEALESEHDALLLEAEETEQEALQWQQIALTVTRRLAQGSDQYATLLAAMEKPLNRATCPPPTEDYSAFLEECEMANAARSLAARLALSEEQLEHHEVGIQRLTEQLELQQEVAAAEAAEEEWHWGRLRSAKQSIAKHMEAIRLQSARAEKTSSERNALQLQKQQLLQEHQASKAEELEEYQRRKCLETEHQEVQSEMLGLCEELASANHLAEMALEEQLHRSRTELESLESTDASLSPFPRSAEGRLQRLNLPPRSLESRSSGDMDRFSSTPTFGNAKSA